MRVFLAEPPGQGERPVSGGALRDERSGASMAAIQHHYDVSNEFFALWLDRSLTYSCALWSGDEDLADANRRPWFICSHGALG